MIALYNIYITTAATTIQTLLTNKLYIKVNNVYRISKDICITFHPAVNISVPTAQDK